MYILFSQKLWFKLINKQTARGKKGLLSPVNPLCHLKKTGKKNNNKRGARGKEKLQSKPSRAYHSKSSRSWFPLTYASNQFGTQELLFVLQNTKPKGLFKKTTLIHYLGIAMDTRIEDLILFVLFQPIPEFR